MRNRSHSIKHHSSHLPLFFQSSLNNFVLDTDTLFFVSTNANSEDSRLDFPFFVIGDAPRRIKRVNFFLGKIMVQASKNQNKFFYFPPLKIKDFPTSQGLYALTSSKITWTSEKNSPNNSGKSIQNGKRTGFILHRFFSQID